MKLISVRRRNKIQQEEVRHEEDLRDENQEARNNIHYNDTVSNGIVDDYAE